MTDDGDARSAASETFEGLIGVWHGEGSGDYPTIEPFSFVEEIRFRRVAEDALGYEQRATTADGELLHTEVGIWRLRPSGRLEVSIAFPSVAEVTEGMIDDGRVELESTSVGRATLGAQLRSARRTYTLDGGSLTYDIEMAARDVPMTWHLSAVMRRQG